MYERSTPGLALLAAAALFGSACGGSSSNDPPPPTTPPVIASFGALPPSVAPGGASTLSWTVTGATSLSIDKGVGTVTGTSVQVSPTATTSYTLTATNAVGSTSSSPVTVVVTTGGPALEVACTGTGCGASSASLYAGSGIGIWRYRNTTAAPVTLDVAIGGVTASLQPVLLFSNGSASATTLPAPLTMPTEALLQAPVLSEADLAREARDLAHWEVSERNRRTALLFQETIPTGTPAIGLAPAVSLAPPAVSAIGNTFTWLDLDEATPGNTGIRPNPSTTRGVCDLSTGRKAAFWVADNAWNVNMTATDLDVFKALVCGTDKGYDQLKAMIGDAWGLPVASSYPSELIQDTPVLQDIHVVFANLPGDSLAGYFWQCNNFRKGKAPSNCPDTNEALVVFVNARMVTNDQAGQGSTVLHEMTHLVNFYQRTLVKSSGYDTWLEEMSAMMTEDIVVPMVSSGRIQDIPLGRVKPYVGNGGAVNLMKWDGGKSYNLGATFGAFLSRRFGTAIYSGMKTCPTTSSDPAISVSYACLDGLIRTGGGESLADEFARMGASVYGLVPATGSPDRYGMPAKRITDAYSLGAIDLASYANVRPSVATSIGGSFLATTHTYKIDTVPAGITDYTRTGVVVPANTTLMVVIKP